MSVAYRAFWLPATLLARLRSASRLCGGRLLSPPVRVDGSPFGKKLRVLIWLHVASSSRVAHRAPLSPRRFEQAQQFLLSSFRRFGPLVYVSRSFCFSVGFAKLLGSPASGAIDINTCAWGAGLGALVAGSFGAIAGPQNLRAPAAAEA